jgi:hypothetical protein
MTTFLIHSCRGPAMTAYGFLSSLDYVNKVWLLLYAHKHRSILGAAGHIILKPANQLMEEYISEPPEQSCLLRWTEKIASLRFCPSGDRTPYLLIRSPPLIDCATGSGLHVNKSSKVMSGHFITSRNLILIFDSSCRGPAMTVHGSLDPIIKEILRKKEEIYLLIFH